jgi:type VI secretion system secreted protein VgrG
VYALISGNYRTDDRDERGLLMPKLTPILVWSTFSLCVSAQITLGPTISTFSVLGGSTVTSTGATVVVGNLGLGPGSAVTGFPPGTVSSPSTIQIANAITIQAQADLTNALTATAAALPVTANLTGQDLGTVGTLTPGIYKFNNSAQLTGTLTLNALGNANAQFIFQIATTLTTASGSSVVLTNNAQAANVFFEVGTSATLGSTTAFVGNILASSSISLNAGASLLGRALASTGAVTLIDNAITLPLAIPAGGFFLTATPAPPTLILFAIGLACAGIYQARDRILERFRSQT